jgi:hypothetical protein
VPTVTSFHSSNLSRGSGTEEIARTAELRDPNSASGGIYVKFLFTTSCCVCVHGVGHMPIVSLCPHTPQLANSLDVQ